MTKDRCNALKQRLAVLIRSGNYDRERPRRGEVYEATILSMGENDIVVDLEAKRDGIIPLGDPKLVGDR